MAAMETDTACKRKRSPADMGCMLQSVPVVLSRDYCEESTRREPHLLLPGAGHCPACPAALLYLLLL